MVNIEDSPKKPFPRPKGKVTNDNLPLSAKDNNRWLHTFVPTMAWFMSIQENPWTISDEDLRAALQKVWDVVYKKTVPHTVVINDAVFQLVSTPTPCALLLTRN